MKMRNVAFQVRDAYWRSKARLLINWLLSRLGLMVKCVDTAIVKNFDFITKVFISLFGVLGLINIFLIMRGL